MRMNASSYGELLLLPRDSARAHPGTPTSTHSSVSGYDGVLGQVYRVEVTCDQDGLEPWTVDRRYNEFYELYELVRSRFFLAACRTTGLLQLLDLVMDALFSRRILVFGWCGVAGGASRS